MATIASKVGSHHPKKRKSSHLEDLKPTNYYLKNFTAQDRKGDSHSQHPMTKEV